MPQRGDDDNDGEGEVVDGGVVRLKRREEVGECACCAEGERAPHNDRLRRAAIILPHHVGVFVCADGEEDHHRDEEQHAPHIDDEETGRDNNQGNDQSLT